MAGERILITGSDGFVGEYLSAELREREYEVYGVGLRSEMDSLIGTYSSLDIVEREATRVHLSRVRPTAVIHLAAIADPRAADRDPYEAVRVNVLGTISVLEAAVAGGARRALVVGSAHEYGDHPEPRAEYRETDPTTPTGVYGMTKLMAERIGRLVGARKGLDVCFTRSFNHAGPGQASTYVLSSFAKQCAEIGLGVREPVVTAGNLDVARDFVDVRDVVRAYVAILERGVPGTTYNVASGRSLRLGDLLDILVGFSGRADVQVMVDQELARAGEEQVIRGDVSLLKSHCGWAPSIPIERTLRDLFDYWLRKLQCTDTSPV